MELDIKFHDVSFTRTRPQASIHLKGKLGFNNDAAEFMELKRSPIFMVGTPSNVTDGSLMYLVEVDEEKGDKTIKTAKAGKYYYLSLKGFFEKMRIPYTDYHIAYDIEKGEIKGRPLYTLKRKRMNKRKGRKGSGSETVASDSSLPFL